MLLAEAYRDDPCPRNLDRLCSHEVGHAKALAVAMGRIWCPAHMDEVDSAGLEGLVVAAKTWNGASPWNNWLRLKIKAEVIEVSRRRDPCSRLTRRHIQAYDFAIEHLRGERRGEPSQAEAMAFAHQMAGSPRRWEPWLFNSSTAALVNVGETSLVDLVEAPNLVSDDDRDLALAKRWIAELDDFKREVIERRLNGESVKAIAADHGYTTSRISQIFWAAVKDMQAMGRGEGVLV